MKIKLFINLIIEIFINILILIYAKVGVFESEIFKGLFISINITFTLFYLILKISKKDKIDIFYKLLICVNLIIFLIEIVKFYDVLRYLTSVIFIKELILSCGGKGLIVFLLIQILEVICLPIPSIVIIIVGTLIYGPIVCFLLCTLGVVIGSLLAFLIGKKLGIKFISWFFESKKINNYISLLDKNAKYFLTLAFLLPLFPDDLLCFVAGISRISFKEFLIITICTKPIGIFMMCFLGTSFKIKFQGWGILFWGIVLLIILFLFFYIIKNKKTIKSMFINKKSN